MTDLDDHFGSDYWRAVSQHQPTSRWCVNCGHQIAAYPGSPTGFTHVASWNGIACHQRGSSAEPTSLSGADD